MFRSTPLRASAWSHTRNLLGGGMTRHRGTLQSKFNRATPASVMSKVGVVMEIPPYEVKVPEIKAKAPETKVKTPEVKVAVPDVKTHTPPSTVLTKLLEKMIVKQKTFLLGPVQTKKGDHPEGNFFQVIEDSYKKRMKVAFQQEVEDFKTKRETYYAKRLSEETEEYRRECRAVHDQLYRAEGDRYRKCLTEDIKAFTTSRQKEYEARLRDDIRMYNGALLSYHSTKGEGGDAQLNLAMNTPEVADAMRHENAIFDFGTDNKGNGNDLTDDDIRMYVTERFHFYEKYLQEEMKRFTARRKGFYEDLLQASAIRHAAKVRTDTEAFHDKREEYYEEQIARDVVWMERSLENHYNVCFLQLYAREAWLSHRSEYIKGNAKTEDDLGSINIGQLEKLVSLDSILTIYERESIGDASREAFVSAGRRVVKMGPGGDVSDDMAHNEAQLDEEFEEGAEETDDNDNMESEEGEEDEEDEHN